MSTITQVTREDFIEALDSLVSKRQLTDIAICYMCAPDRETKYTTNQALLYGMQVASRAGEVLPIVRLVPLLYALSTSVAHFLEPALARATRLAGAKDLPLVSYAIQFGSDEKVTKRELAVGDRRTEFPDSDVLMPIVMEMELRTIKRYFEQRADREIDFAQIAHRKLEEPDTTVAVRELERAHRKRCRLYARMMEGVRRNMVAALRSRLHLLRLSQ